MQVLIQHTRGTPSMPSCGDNVKGPRKAVLGYKIAPNRFKTTYRSVLTFEEKKQSITHLLKTFGADSSLLDCCDLVVCFFHPMLAD